MIDKTLTLLILLAGMASASLASPESDFSFSGGLPNCDAIPSGREPNTLTDQERDASALHTYCDGYDRSAAKETFIITHLASRAKQYDRIDAAFFSITDSGFSRALCQSLKSDIRRLRIISGGDPRWIKDMRACANGSGYRSLLSVSEIPGILSFHPKFIVMSKDASAEIFITSGNPTSKAKNNLDFNLLIQMQTDQSFYLWHSCVAQLLDRNYKVAITLDSLKKDYDACKGSNSAWKGISPMLLPFDSNIFVAELAFWAGRSRSIKLLSQGYDSPVLLKIILAAREAGQKVGFIRDDDILLTPFGVRNLQNSFSEFLSWDKDLCAVGITPRFIVTNTGQNYLHAKVIIFEGDFGSVVYFGSANATLAATSGNLENVYISTNKEVNNKFIEYYAEVLNDSVSYAEWSSIAKKIGPYKVFSGGLFDECY